MTGCHTATRDHLGCCDRQKEASALYHGCGYRVCWRWSYEHDGTYVMLRGGDIHQDWIAYFYM